MAHDVMRTDTTISQVVLMTSSMSKVYGLVQLKLRMLWYVVRLFNIRDLIFCLIQLLSILLVILLLHSITSSNSLFQKEIVPLICWEYKFLQVDPLPLVSSQLYHDSPWNFSTFFAMTPFGNPLFLLKKTNCIHCWQDNHDAVAETAVVGYPHEIKGQGLSINNNNILYL